MSFATLAAAAFFAVDSNAAGGGAFQPPLVQTYGGLALPAVGNVYDSAPMATTTSAVIAPGKLRANRVSGGGARATIARSRVFVAAKAGTKLVEGARYPLSPKIQGQLAKRGWTTEAIDEAVQSGKQVRAVNKATGDPATRYIHPSTGQSVVIDDVTGQVIHVGGPGFKYGPGSGDVP